MLIFLCYSSTKFLLHPPHFCDIIFVAKFNIEISMVYCMTVYTVALKFGWLSYQVFSLAIKEMWLEYIVVFCLIFFLITNTAKNWHLESLIQLIPSQYFLVLAIQCFTVCQIVPVITLFATLEHNGISSQWFCQWIQLAVICFPMALCLQVFFVGPLVRLIFRTIFKNQLNNN